jgi:peptidoglycan/xylan/chitin deacetylase (PgdA/CDA1 family)
MGVRASCTTNAVTFERRKAMVDACLERGWELLAHNYEQGELLTDFAHDEQAERDIIRRSIEMYERHVGVRPKGWLSSSLRGTLNTPAILAEEGFEFYCDLMNDDQPYLIRTDKGTIVSTPYSNEINDFTLLTRRNHTTDEFRDILKEELTVLHEEGRTQARIMNVGLHPHVSGRAYRVRGLREFLEFAKTLPGVWWTTRQEIAEYYRTQAETHMPGQAG